MNKNNRLFYMGLIWTGILVLLTVTGFFWTPYLPDAMQGSMKLQAPSLQHLMGTDQFGRDVLSRVLTGAGNTVLIACGTLVIGGVTGMILGCITGYSGGIVDEILMRLCDILASFPHILLALVFVSVLGPGKYKIMSALGIIFIPSFARVVRGEILKIRETDYVKSARLIGVPMKRILLVHMLPNILPTLLAALTVGFNNAVIAEAGMSYLGIGVQPPDASLGRMLSESQTYLSGGPWCALFPGIFIVLLVLGISFLGEGISEKFGGGR